MSPSVEDMLTADHRDAGGDQTQGVTEEAHRRRPLRPVRPATHRRLGRVVVSDRGRRRQRRERMLRRQTIVGDHAAGYGGDGQRTGQGGYGRG
jgi:hypothetical protein